MIVVGLWSLGLSLIVVGLVLLVESLTGHPGAARLADLWGLVPAALGLELLIASYRASRRQDQPVRIRLHRGAAAGLAALVLVAVLAKVSLIPGLGWLGLDLDRLYQQEATATLENGVTADASVSEIDANTPPGTWTIRGGDGTLVAAECDLTVKARTLTQAREAAAGASIQLSIEGHQLRVRLAVPGYAASAEQRTVWVTADGRLTIPRGLDLVFRTATGSVVVSDLDGRVDLDTGTGSITVERVAGAVTVRSATGEVRLEGVGGDVEAGTSTGAIFLTDIGGAASIDTATGPVEVIRVAGRVKIDGQTGRVRVAEPGAGVSVRLSTGGCEISSAAAPAGDWLAATSTGDINVRFPRTSDVTLSAKTDTGSISNNVGLAVSASGARKTMDGVLGTGEHEISLTAGTGSITVVGLEE